MTFRTNNPSHDVLPTPAGASQLSGASAPAFRPQIGRSLRMHPLLAACVALAVFAGLVGYAVLQKPVYSAESLVYLEPMTPKLVNDGNAALFDSGKYDAFLGEQTQLMQRPDVLATALSTLPKSTWAMLGATPQAAAASLQAQLKVQRVMTSYQVSVSLKGEDAAKTADIVNAVVLAYLEAGRKATAAESDERAQLLMEERQRITDELQSARAEQTALGASIGVANPTGESGNPYDSELSGVRAQLMEARAAHDVAAAQLASISSSGRGSGLAVAAEDLMSGDPGLSSTRANIAQRKATLSAQMAGLTPANPIYKQDQDETLDLDRSLEAATTEARGRAERRLQDKLKTDLDRTGDVEARLNGELSHQIMNATSAAPKLQRASEVAADIQRLDIREAAVDDTLRSLRMAQHGPGQVRVSLQASPATSPDPSKKKLLLLAALPLAMLFALGAAVFARRQDKRIYGTLDVGDVLGFPPMAVLPSRDEVGDRVYDEYVLRLAAGIESAYRSRDARTFLLTAVSLTTDIRPLTTALARKFEEIGVNAAVATASEMLAPSGDVPAADEQETPAELARTVELWREGFVAANISRLKTEHGLVLIEAEALLNCGQTEYVARCADATVLLIESGVTTRDELYRAAELLERLNVTGIGAVLEDLRLQFADGPLRAAIGALERRQEQARPMQRTVQVPVRVRTVAPPVSVPVVEQPRVQEVAETPSAVVMEAAAAPVAAEPEVVAAEVVAAGAEPAGAEPAEAEPVAEVQAPEEAETATVPEEIEEFAAGRPVLVEHEFLPAQALEENLQEEPMIALANGTTHEKMASTLTGRRLPAGPVGDSTMNRKASWLDRLLRRDEETSFRIVPDDDDENETSDEAAVAPASAGSALKNKQEEDLPLVARLEQISRIRPAIQGTVYNSGARGTRLTIVPQEMPAELVVPQAEPFHGYLPEPVEAETFAAEVEAPPEPIAAETVAPEPEHEPAPLPVAAEIVSAALPAPIEWWREERQQLKPLAEIARYDMAHETPGLAEPVATPISVPAAGPRRPFSFHELMQMAPGPVPTPEPVEAMQPEEPAVEQPVYIEPVVEPQTEPMAEIAAPEAEPLALEPVVEEPAVIIEPVALEPVFAEPEAVMLAPEMVPEMASEMASEVAPETAPAEEAESFDIEPVYEAASRHLTTGRWDPIPTLRPDNGWRDRSAQLSAAGRAGGNGDRPRWTQEDGAGIARRAPEETANAEPAGEPALSRQWGLLSKFQQARISSGSRPAAPDADKNEPLREPANGQR